MVVTDALYEIELTTWRSSYDDRNDGLRDRASDWEVVDRSGHPHLFDMFPFGFEPSSTFSWHNAWQQRHDLQSKQVYRRIILRLQHIWQNQTCV